MLLGFSFVDALHKHPLEVRLLEDRVVKEVLHTLLPLPCLLYLCLRVVIIAEVALLSRWLRLFLLGSKRLVAWLPPGNG